MKRRSFFLKPAAGALVRPRELLTLGLKQDRTPLRIGPITRSKHMFVVGSTGSGKTTFLEQLIWQDILAGRGVTVIDPHGDLYQRLVQRCASESLFRRLPEIMLLAPSSREWVMPFNNFCAGEGDLSTRVDRRVQAFLQAWSQANTDETPRLAKTLKIVFTAACEAKLTLPEAAALIDPSQSALRSYVSERMSDPILRSKLEQFDNYKLTDLLAQVESSESRLLRFVCSGVITRMMGLGTNALQPRTIMDQGKVVLVDASLSDWVSREQQRLIVTMVVNEYFEEAMRRPTGSREHRLHLDEAGLFVGPEIGEALDQLRKRGLNLTLAGQHLWQFRTDPKVYKSVKNNTHVKVIFAIPDRQDASEVADDLFRDLAEPKVKQEIYHLAHRITDHEAWEPGLAFGLNGDTSDAQSVTKTKTTNRGTNRKWGQGSQDSSGRSGDLDTSNSGFTNTFEQGEHEDEGKSDGKAHQKGSRVGFGFNLSLRKQRWVEHTPIQELTSRQCWSLEETRWKAAEQIMNQETGHCFIKIGGSQAIPIQVPALRAVSIRPEKLQHYTQALHQQHSLPVEQAEQIIAERRQWLIEQAQNHHNGNGRRRRKPGNGEPDETRAVHTSQPHQPAVESNTTTPSSVCSPADDEDFE